MTLTQRANLLLQHRESAGILDALLGYLTAIDPDRAERLAKELSLEPLAGPAPEIAYHPPRSGSRGRPGYELPESYVLHLSDLHFRSVREVGLRLDQLEADLSQGNALGLPRIDVIVASGDISDTASTEQYAAATQFFAELRRGLGLPVDRLVLVPGNHDVSWPLSQSAYEPWDPTENAERAPRLAEGEAVDVEGRRYFRRQDAYLRRFAPFAEFFQAACQKPYPLDEEQQATVHPFPELKLLFLGLNSAWSIDHQRAFRGRASINGGALAQALRSLRQQEKTGHDGWLKIGVWHHPVHSPDDDHIRDSAFLDRLSLSGFRICMHGHRHRAENGVHRSDPTPGGCTIDLLGAGTFGAPSEQWASGVPLQYQVLHIKGGTLTVYSRCRDKPEGAWRADGRWGFGKTGTAHYELEL